MSLDFGGKLYHFLTDPKNRNSLEELPRRNGYECQEIRVGGAEGRVPDIPKSRNFESFTRNHLC